MNDKKHARELLFDARGQLVGRYGQAILVIVLVGFLNLLLGSFADYTYTGTLGSYLMRILVLTIIDLLLGVLFFGQDRYFLNLVRGVQGLSPADLFHGIKNNADKAICLQAVYTLVSVITVIPAAYLSFFVPLTESEALRASLLLRLGASIILFTVRLFFGLSFYILADHPDYGVLQILSESNRLMTGNRLRFIVLALRMIPFMILGVLAFIVGFLWPTAIYQTALANFYLDIIGEKPYNPLTDELPTPEPDPRSQLLM
ncbi:MAG: DUF975 family protein [Lachnospiraceae bacterium]|nr:DUF975 family protein [Lachnospiraceae bacterium]